MTLDEKPKQREGLALQLLNTLTQTLNVIGSSLIVVVASIVCVDVISRNAANAPLSGVPEIVTLCIVGIVFLQAPQALREGRIPQSTAISDALAKASPTAARVLGTILDFLGMVITGIVFYATLPIFLKAWERNEFIGSIGDFTAPVWPIKLAVLIGSAMLILQLLAGLIRRWEK
ncbi:TRAP-type mannitol/chloroaromatic compound transport system, small permease component [Octadecabacter temperatus]|uniref:TRAP transporter small permease protein n=1 Tax=Octadecabacter temperatus TaxID=1458307 RepID=A0A0K0Y845_9RHOB|nr:TRAP transporter small permease [Octadecabacter temperatus]AKS47144.1 Tripartite ATP-independent periplasmic transporter, DctQ component [Octadecabacter temperatus]SIO46001.1 TRAP-type mannitol/chloroaromatic compound transport system, small permease component [Octadecabacter temperatus]